MSKFFSSSCLLAGVVTVYAGWVLNSLADLSLHYAFEGDFSDSGPSNNVGTASGTAAVTSDPAKVVVGTGALQLDGSDTSYVALSTAITFGTNSPWSVAFWVRRGETASSKSMVMGARGDSNNFIWLPDNVAGMGLRFRPSVGGSYDFPAPRDQKLHHYALVASGSRTLSLYIDGALSLTKTSVPTSFLIDTIGQAYPTTSHYAFKGMLDEVRVYNDAIDATAVSALYAEGVNLRLHYAFDGDATDSSTNVNDGTVGGGLVFMALTNQVPVGSGALVGDGGDASYVSLATNITFGSTVSWSAAFWAQRGETGGQKGMVLGCRTNNNDFIWLNDAFTGFRFRNSAGSDVDFTTPSDTLRHHYALVAEGNGTMSLYLDGTIVSNKSASNTSFLIDTVGQAYTTNSLHYAFQGVLDDVRVYSFPLNASAVSGLYGQGRALLFHYAFDGDCSDSGGRGNDGTPGGNAATTADPSQVNVASGALALDGGDTSAVSLSNAVTFTNGAPWSAAFWARRGEVGASKGMIMGRANTYADFIWLNDNFNGFRFRSSTSNTVDFTAAKDLLPHHYALVAEGNGTMSLYIDGLLSANKGASDTSFMINTVGQGYFTSSHIGFSGNLDDVRVYNYALDAETVSVLSAMGGAEQVRYAFEGDFTDGSPYGNDGTASGNATLTTSAMVGTNALALDGTSSSYVTLSSAITYATGVPWSAAFWAQRAGTANQGMVMGNPANNNDFIWITDNFNGFRFRSTSGTTVDFTGPKDLNSHHYALVAEGNGRMSLYIDGLLSTNLAVANTSFKITTIGKAYSNSGYEFKGVLDDVRVFDYALAATNVTFLYELASLEPPLPPVTVTRVHVFLQGGQSNSEGRADPAGLPTSPVNLQGYQNDVDFYYSSVLSTLHPATPGTPITTFGPEITCGRHLVDLMQPDASNRVAIIKYSAGGTSLYSDWMAGGDATTTGDGPRYVGFQAMVASGLAALAAAYPEADITIEGMIWMQGESDVPSASAAYYANLKAFIADVRLTYNLPKLPFIIGRLSASQTGAGNVTLLNVVRQAQTDVAAEDRWTGLVDTDTFQLKTDNLHFDTAGQQDLGNAFAEQLLYLINWQGTLLKLF